MGKLVVFTGAGISAESGVPTFRDANGLWENHKIEEVCTYSTYKDNFELVHKFYNGRRTSLASVNPNYAHQMVAKWSERYDTTVITQNIDDLHERGGSKNVVHVHGFITEMKCQHCSDIIDIGYEEWNHQTGCNSCNENNKNMKPNVVFFGESAPKYWDMEEIFINMTENDALVVIGTNGQVVPISYIAAQIQPKFKALNVLELGLFLDPNNFTNIYCEPATSAVDKINTDLIAYFGY